MDENDGRRRRFFVLFAETANDYGVWPGMPILPKDVTITAVDGNTIYLVFGQAAQGGSELFQPGGWQSNNV